LGNQRDTLTKLNRRSFKAKGPGGEAILSHHDETSKKTDFNPQSTKTPGRGEEKT